MTHRMEDLNRFAIKDPGLQGRPTMDADTLIKNDDVSDPLPRFSRSPTLF
jgi:hypothetical protein